MDEQAIKRAAEEAMSDLQLDCEVKEVCRSSGGDEWCVQFSGKYGQFCDEFKNQFGKENNPRIVQEKIKRHLLKQVTKIRSSTGKSRRPKAKSENESSTQTSLMSAPLEVVGEVLSRASQMAGSVVEQAAGVSDAARQTIANMSDSLSLPVSAEIETRAEQAKDDVVVKKSGRRGRAATKRRAAKSTKATSGKTSRTVLKVARPATKRAKKAGKKVAKSGRKVKKAGQRKR